MFTSSAQSQVVRTASCVGVGLTLLALLTGCVPVAIPTPSISLGVWFQSTNIAGNERVRVYTQSHPIRVLFTQQDQGLVMIANGPVNGYTVPVTVQGSTIRPDHTRRSAVTTVGCAAMDDPTCVVDRWMGTWATQPLHFSTNDSRLQLGHGALRISLRAIDAPKT
jgi:hypothetical protein